VSSRRLINILLVEDNKLNMLGLKLRLEKMGGFNIVGEAYDGLQAVDKALTLRPDVVLMDVGLPVIDGIESCRQINTKWPDACVIMLTLNDEPAVEVDCLKAGAVSYCSKEIGNNALSEAIDKALGDKLN
jgi:DNA-binding NarL/FixJ family response regulator